MLLATLVGLVVMHQLAGGPDVGATSHAAKMAATTMVDEHCSTPDDGCSDDGRKPDRDDPRQGHAGQVCQFTPPAGGPVSVPALVVAPDGAATAPSAVSPRTATQQAAEGSGCGPPSLSQLSVFRI